MTPRPAPRAHERARIDPRRNPAAAHHDDGAVRGRQAGFVGAGRCVQGGERQHDDGLLHAHDISSSPMKRNGPLTNRSVDVRPNMWTTTAIAPAIAPARPNVILLRRVASGFVSR